MSPEATTNKAPVVLVVDDDVTGRLLARSSLENMGFVVVEATDGDQAIARVDERAPDVILLDVTLRGRDGFQICAELRTREGLEDIPIVMITGNDDVESVTKSYQMGATDFVAKPVNWLIMVQRVLSLLRASRTLDELQENRRQLAHAHRIAQLGSWSYDAAEDLLWLSKEARVVIQDLAGRELSKEDLLNRLHPDDRAGVLETFERQAGADGDFTFEFRVTSAAEGERHIRACAERGSRAAVFTGTVQDVTEQALAEEKIRFLAYHDSLTCLGNRTSFKQRLSEAIERTSRGGDCIGVMYLDLDGFKRVNDKHGHSIGDQLLREVANRLRSCVRGTDAVVQGLGGQDEHFVARLGGDEFTIVLEDVKDPSDLATVAGRIARSLPRPMMVEGNEFAVTGCMGLATWPKDGDDMESLLQRADVAMYQAKARGPGSYAFYSDAMNTAEKNRVALEAKLRDAIEAGDMTLHFQPLARASDSRIVGCEALVRWEPKKEPAIAPDIFIPVAEEIGLIGKLGLWVLETACAQAAEWKNLGVCLPVSVNLSAHQIRPGLPGLVTELLERNGLSPADLVIEITEKVMMREEARPLPILEELRDLGVGLALDDFGTGYSSLSYLRRFPVDRLKIDRSFVRDIQVSLEDRCLIEAILAMAKALNLQVIAEGLENEWQREFLRDHGCDAFQGYLIGRPLDADGFAALVLAMDGRGGTDRSAPASARQ